MTVYVVCHGEWGEGKDPMSVHRTKANAVRAARRLMRLQRRGEWVAEQRKGSTVAYWCGDAVEVVSVVSFPLRGGV